MVPNYEAVLPCLFFGIATNSLFYSSSAILVQPCSFEPWSPHYSMSEYPKCSFEITKKITNLATFISLKYLFNTLFKTEKKNRFKHGVIANHFHEKRRIVMGPICTKGELCSSTSNCRLPIKNKLFLKPQVKSGSKNSISSFDESIASE